MVQLLHHDVDPKASDLAMSNPIAPIYRILEEAQHNGFMGEHYVQLADQLVDMGYMSPTLAKLATEVEPLASDAFPALRLALSELGMPVLTEEQPVCLSAYFQLEDGLAMRQPPIDSVWDAVQLCCHLRNDPNSMKPEILLKYEHELGAVPSTPTPSES